MLRLDDVYPDAMIYAGVVPADGVIANLVNFLNRRLFNGAERIIVLGRDMARLIEKRLQRKDARIVTIPNWADVEKIHPTPRSQNRLLMELGLLDKFVIGYAGNLGPLQGIEYLFECVQRLRGFEKLHFVFVGTGKRALWLTEAVKNAGLKNITLVGQRPRSDQINFLNACDVGLVSLVRGMSGVGVPSRTYNIMAAGKPVIAAVDADSEVALIIQEEQIGWIVSPGDPVKFGEAILEAQADPIRLASMGRRARAAAEAKYSCELVVKQYQRLLG